MEVDSLFPDQALWIGSDHPFDLHEAYLRFRSPDGFSLGQMPQQAELRITADSRYRLWINGQFVTRGPARCYPRHQSVDRLDVRSHLWPGRNVIAVQVYQPGYSHFAYVHRGAAGLLLSLYADGQPVLVTDAEWRVSRDPSFAEQVPRVSIYGAGVEIRDMSLSEPWQQPGYDAGDWAKARVVAEVGGYPWLQLEPRALPLLREERQPLTLVEGRCGPVGQRHPDAHITLDANWRAARPASFSPDPDGRFPLRLGRHETASLLFDLGQDHTCAGEAEVRGAGGAETVAISYHEKIRDGQLVISDPGTYCRVRMTDVYHLRQGDQLLEPFTLRGGRYLLFQITGPTGPDFAIRPLARVSVYPLALSKPLELHDPELADIVALCERTFVACLQDGFVDSTWRESSQWLGDALPQALIMSSVSDDLRPLRRVIDMAAQGAYPDGVLPSVLPGEVHAYVIVDYNFIWVELLELYLRLSQDAVFVQGMWPTLVKMLDRFHRDRDEQGLLHSQPGRRLFLDWAPVSRNEPNAIYNLHYLLALQTAAHLGGRLGDLTQADRWQARAAALQAAARTAFWRDGRWYDDLDGATFSQLAAALALLTGSTLPEEEEALLDAIAQRSLDDDDSYRPGTMVLASPFMHHYIFEALRQGGRDDQVIEIIRRRWGRWTKAGYPTAWENWNVDFPDGSQCHAFSAHPRYHLAAIAQRRTCEGRWSP
ncbi:MAG: hypothetical protein D6791_18375 [Chloroflexi bacterium]|nr:MAG: hypothetical protein D6791_18375 [Chloroflexota bacterium]